MANKLMILIAGPYRSGTDERLGKRIFRNLSEIAERRR
jgi:hypothetical protein